jgi:hypothetical protein
MVRTVTLEEKHTPKKSRLPLALALFGVICVVSIWSLNNLI